MILLALFLAANLGDYMPPDVQQRTGITSLTRRQQGELANWLSNNMQASETPAKKELTLAENYHGGRVLQLNDGSIWEVAPEDVNYTGLWITPFPIHVSESTNPRYPYKLTNLVSGTSVHVRRIYTVNPPDIPKEPPVDDKRPEAQYPTPQQKPIPPAKPPKHKAKPKPGQQNPQGPGFTETNPGSTTIEPNTDQLPGLPPGPGQGGPSPTPSTK